MISLGSRTPAGCNVPVRALLGNRSCTSADIATRWGAHHAQLWESTNIQLLRSRQWRLSLKIPKGQRDMKHKLMLSLICIIFLAAALAREGSGSQTETPPMPSQRLDPKIQKIVAEISADR